MNQATLQSPGTDLTAAGGLLRSGQEQLEVHNPAAPLTAHVISALFRSMVVVCAAWPSVLTTPHWAHASWIGCVWGGIFLAGLDCSWSQHRLRNTCSALLMSAVGYQSLRALTDLEHNACWAVVVAIATCGWCLGWLMTPWRSTTRQPALVSAHNDGLPTASQGVKRVRRGSRWGLWDIAGLATSVACLTWFVPRIENQFDLLCQLGPAVVCGALVCVLAIEWGWRDRWSLRGLTGIALACVAIGGLCIRWAPSGLNGQVLLVWFVSGPASAIAAQGLVVLSAMAALRIDTNLAETESALADRKS